MPNRFSRLIFPCPRTNVVVLATESPGLSQARHGFNLPYVVECPCGEAHTFARPDQQKLVTSRRPDTKLLPDHAR